MNGEDYCRKYNDQGRIVIVDDEPANLDYLQDALCALGCSISVFPDGEMALAGMRQETPDLALLDVRMEGKDGYHVCKEMKRSPNLKHIPVIFLSALNEKKNIVQGFDAGAVDYITKPFFEAEVLARVKTHLALAKAHKEIQEQCDLLREQESLRDSLIHMIVHDMRAPLQAILGYLQLLNEESTNWGAVNKECLMESLQGVKRLQRMIADMLDVNRAENNVLTANIENIDLNVIINDVVKIYINPKDRNRVNINAQKECPRVEADSDLCTRIIANMIGNAIKYSPAEEKVFVRTSVDENRIRITVQDNGPGIEPHLQEHIFEKFGTAATEASDGRKSTGIGLSFCKLAAEAQNGTVEVESSPGQGSAFTFTLPIQHEKNGVK
jgi:two-component system, sensor histidine kinase and response regulator